MATVVLYSKAGCHLCEAVHQTITAVARRRAFSFELRNILDNPADYECYKHTIPVVTVNSVEIGHYRLTVGEFEKALDAADSVSLPASGAVD